MKNLRIVPVLVVSAMAFLLAAQASAAFDQLFEKYDLIRAALAADNLKGVPEAAAALAGVAEAQKLPRVAADAKAVAKATKLDDARAAFGKLSASLIEYRKTSQSKSGVVAYCPMAKQSWLQRDTKITNPYYGASMLKCGEIVKD